MLMPLEPMSPLRQATLLGSSCYSMGNAANCWDLPVDYSKIKHVDEDENEVKGGKGMAQTSEIISYILFRLLLLLIGVNEYYVILLLLI